MSYRARFALDLSILSARSIPPLHHPLPLPRNNHRIPKLRKHPDLIQHESDLTQQPLKIPPRPLPRIMHGLHRNPKRRRIIRAGLPLAQHKILNQQHAPSSPGTHGRRLMAQNLDALGIVPVVQDPAQEVRARPDHGLRREEIVTRSFDAEIFVWPRLVRNLALGDHVGAVLQDDAPGQRRERGAQSLALPAEAAADVDEEDVFGRRVGCDFGTERHRVEPGWQAGEDGFHEPVEGALLDWVRLQPRVDVGFGRVVPDLKCRLRWAGCRLEGAVQACEGG